jgi:hypothetical protein
MAMMTNGGKDADATLADLPAFWRAYRVLRAIDAQPGLGPRFGTSSMHFYVVSATTLAAMAACALVIGVTDSLRETRLVFLALAFLCIAGIFAVHGLGTPGYIHSHVYPEILVSSWLSVFLGALLIAASVMSMPEKWELWLKHNGGYLAASVTLAVAAYMGCPTRRTVDQLPSIQNRGLQLLMTAQHWSWPSVLGATSRRSCSRACQASGRWSA